MNQSNEITVTQQPKAHGAEPKTPESPQHGLPANSPTALDILARKAGIDFNDIHISMSRHYMPKDPVEGQLVRRIARCVWRLALGEAMEARVLRRARNLKTPEATYEKILEYEGLVGIHLHRAVQALRSKRRTEKSFQLRKTNSRHA